MPFTKHSTEGRMCGLRKEVKYGQARSHGGGAFGGSVPQISLFPENLFQKYDKNKNLAPLKCIFPLQTSKPGYGPEYGAAQSWDESQWGFSFYGIKNELLLRIFCHTERLKPFQVTTGGQKNFRSDWVSFLLLFIDKIREQTRLTSLHCSQGYRHSVEQHVDSLWYRVCSIWVCSLTSIVL